MSGRLARLASGFARAALRLIPRGMIVPVVAGPLRGMWWVASSAPHGAWLGRLERPLLDDFSRRVPQGGCVWDVGANVGLYTLAAARRTGPTGEVIAFEPLPLNVARLRRHLALNQLRQVTVVDAAVSNVDGRAHMRESTTPSEFHIDPGGPVEVRTVALDSWLATSGRRPPDIIKIDVEGAESLVLEGARNLLRATQPVIYLSVHTPEQNARCRQLLDAAKYVIRNVRHEPWPFGDSEWIAIHQV